MTSKTAAQLVADAKAEIENLTPEDVLAEQEDSRTLLIDIREQEERARTGVITGSIHAPRGMIEFYADPTGAYHREEFDPERRIILYCASGGRSALATRTLREMGYRNVAHLDKGINGWTERGLPLTTPN